jgi:dTDP-4-amino-4,6-dideoxygalactose transaminase
VTNIPFHRPYLSGEEAAAVARVLESGWLSQGPRVRAFEAAFARRVGAAEAVATTSCTTALALALYVSGVGRGDEVIVPSLSFIATANAVWHCGATPVFADVDPHTFNLDAAAAARAITHRTRAIMPVHQLGLPADMDALLDVAERHGLAVVEDAACAIGARYRQRPIGSLRSPACFSLHPRKVITAGEGGMIAVQDPDTAERLRRLRQHAMDVSDLARHTAHDVIFESYPERGWNARMTDVQAAIGLCQLALLDDVLDLRKRLATRYTAALADVPYLEPPYDPLYAERTWQSYAVTLSPDAPIGRDELMRRLMRDGISTRRGVMAIHLEPAYAGARADLPHTEEAARRTMLLPLFPDLTFEQQDRIVRSLAVQLGAVMA